MIIQKENIIITFQGQYNELLEEFLDKFYSKYVNLSKKLNISNVTLNIELMSKEDLDKYVLNNSNYTSIPSWMVGFTSKENIHVLYPNIDNINYIVQVTVHEAIHLMLYTLDIKDSPLKILDEGMATYFSNQMSNEKFDKIVEDYKNNSLKNISDFFIDNSLKFGEMRGYSYSFFLIKYLYNTIGINKILEYFCNPNLFINDVNIYENNFKKYLIKTIESYITSTP